MYGHSEYFAGSSNGSNGSNHMTQYRADHDYIGRPYALTCCVVAMTRESAPESSAIEIIADVAQGAVYQAAVLPGM
jgi:hypothetical protein